MLTIFGADLTDGASFSPRLKASLCYIFFFSFDDLTTSFITADLLWKT